MASIKDKTAATIPVILKTTFKNVITQLTHFYFLFLGLLVLTYIQAGNVIIMNTLPVPPRNDKAAITLGNPIAMPAAAA